MYGLRRYYYSLRIPSRSRIKRSPRTPSLAPSAGSRCVSQVCTEPSRRTGHLLGWRSQHLRRCSSFSLPVQQLVVVVRRQSMHTVALEKEDDYQRLVVIQPDCKFIPSSSRRPHVPAECRLEEAVSLVEAIEGWEVGYQRVDAVRKINNQTFFGRGKTAELKSEVRGLGDGVTGVFINTPTLTPLQHRQLEQLFGKKVFDRFGIVLRIFKERAQTKEAKLQVELAEIPYTYAKLFDQTDGSVGMGETRTDSRRFAMKRRLRQLHEELEEIRNKRRLLREGRAKRTAMPTVAIVGYTNAGKTTLIKALSQDEDMVPKDMLFATLDSTLHGGKLPCGLPVLYVDTIGFVSDLPPELVESFAATLEDSVAADVLVHVIDGSHPQAHAQRENVVRVLERLELRPEMLSSTINVVNKMDRGVVLKCAEGGDGVDGGDILVSATDQTTLSELEARIEEEVLRATGQSFWTLHLPASGPHLSWLYGSDVTIQEVRAAATDDSGGSSSETLQVQAVFSQQTLQKFLAKFSGHQVTMTPSQNNPIN